MQAEEAFPEVAQVEGLVGRIEGGRQSRPMPEELWQEASTAANRLGTGRVARALKQRVISKGSSRHRGETGRQAHPEGTGFIELSGFPALGQSGARDEMVAADGTSLTTHVRGAGPSLTAAIEAFRGRP